MIIHYFAMVLQFALTLTLILVSRERTIRWFHAVRAILSMAEFIVNL